MQAGGELDKTIGQGMRWSAGSTWRQVVRTKRQKMINVSQNGVRAWPRACAGKTCYRQPTLHVQCNPFGVILSGTAVDRLSLSSAGRISFGGCTSHTLTCNAVAFDFYTT